LLTQVDDDDLSDPDAVMLLSARRRIRRALGFSPDEFDANLAPRRPSTSRNKLLSSAPPQRFHSDHAEQAGYAEGPPIWGVPGGATATCGNPHGRIMRMTVGRLSAPAAHLTVGD
jgi:hypothetical protein